MEDSISIKSMEAFSKEREEQYAQLRIQQFFKNWQPHHPEESARFHAEFYQIVQQIYAQASANYIGVITDLSSRMVTPPFIRTKGETGV